MDNRSVNTYNGAMDYDKQTAVPGYQTTVYLEIVTSTNKVLAPFGFYRDCDDLNVDEHRLPVHTRESRCAVVSS